MRPRRFKLVYLSLFLSLGCSSGGPGGTGHGGTGGTSTGVGGQSGQMAGAGGTPSGGNGGAQAGNTGAAGGSGGSSNAGAGAAGASGAAGTGGSSADGGAGQDGGAAGSQGGSGGTGPSAGPFSCSVVIGLFTTSQWFNGNNPGGASKDFLHQDGIDATKWEGKTQKYSYVEKWADPTNAVWNTALTNPCATNSTTPDRAVIVAFSPMDPGNDSDYATYHLATDQPTWETQLNKVIATLKMKFPSAKEIDILTMGRAPNDMLCPNNSDVDTLVQPYEDAAFDAVAAASNGFIKVGPKYFVPDCATSYIYANDSDYTTTAANSLAMQIGAYYATHP